VVKIQSGKEEVHHEIPPLITKKKWEEVNARLSLNKSIPRGPSLQGNFLLKGLLMCGHCKGRLESIAINGFRYYQCRWSLKNPGSTIPKRLRGKRCPLPRIRAERLEGAVFEQVSRAFRDTGPGTIIKAWEDTKTPDVKKLQENRNKVIRRLAIEEKKAADLLDLYTSKEIDRPTLEKKSTICRESIERLRENKKDIEDQIQAAQEQTENMAKAKMEFKDLLKHSKEIFNALQNLTIAQKREFLVLCFEGNRLPVRTLLRGEVEDSQDGELSLEDLSQPLTIKVKGKAIRQVTTDGEITLGGFLKGVEYLKTIAKIEFEPTSKAL